MEKKSENVTIHQKLEAVIKEMVDREVRYKEALQEFEKIYLETAMKKYRGNKTLIARHLGIHRNTLHSRTKLLKIKK